MHVHVCDLVRTPHGTFGVDRLVSLSFPTKWFMKLHLTVHADMMIMWPGPAKHVGNMWHDMSHNMQCMSCHMLFTIQRSMMEQLITLNLPGCKWQRANMAYSQFHVRLNIPFTVSGKFMVCFLEQFQCKPTEHTNHKFPVVGNKRTCNWRTCNWL